MKLEGWFVLILAQLILGWLLLNQYLGKIIQILIPDASEGQILIVYITINVGIIALLECIFSDSDEENEETNLAHD